MAEKQKRALIEVVLELKWAMTKGGNGASGGNDAQADYKLLLGRLSERLQRDYPFHEPLPAARAPDALATHVPQHRFRVAEADWPLVQLGPGLLTINDTHKYTWDDFMTRSANAVQSLYDAHPRPGSLQPQWLNLRYVNALEQDFRQTNLCDFLREHMHVDVKLPQALFAGPHGVQDRPEAFNFQVAFAHTNPGGSATLRFAVGRHEERPSLIWEILVRSQGAQIPHLPDGLRDWLPAAHALAADWYRSLYEGA